MAGLFNVFLFVCVLLILIDYFDLSDNIHLH